MGFYENRVLPYMIEKGCGQPPILEQRRKIVPHAEGRVLEVGMGPGHNLALYDPARVELVWGLEPSEGMRRKAQPNLDRAPVPVEWLGLPGEQIPLDDGDADTVVLTYTLCTIGDFGSALQQMRRVLKPGGRLLFSEHGAAPDASVARWQDRLNPLWKRLAGGCNINRKIDRLIADAGFELEVLETMYLPGTPRIAGFTYWGRAKPA